MRVLSLVVSLAVAQTGSSATPNWAAAWSSVPESTCTNIEMCTVVVDLQVESGLTQAECVSGVNTLKRCLGQVQTCDADSAVIGLTACCEYLQGGNSSAPACPSNTTTTPSSASATTTVSVSVGKGKALTPKGKNAKAAKGLPKGKAKECHHNCFRTVAFPPGGVLEKYKCLVYVNSLESCIRKVCPDQEDTGISPCCDLMDGAKNDNCAITKGMPKAASVQTWVSAFADSLKELTGQDPGNQQATPSVPPQAGATTQVGTTTQVGLSTSTFPPAMTFPPMPMWDPAAEVARMQAAFGGQSSFPSFPTTTTKTTSSSSRTSSNPALTAAAAGIARTNAAFNKNVDAQNKVLSKVNSQLDQINALQTGVTSRISNLNAGINDLQAKISNTHQAFGPRPTPSSSWWDDDDDFWG